MLFVAPARAADWLKTYAASPLKEIWSTELSVRKVDTDGLKAVQAVQKAGGKLTQPLDSFPASATARQMSFRLSREGARRALKSLRRLGRLGEPRKSVPPQLTPVTEVRDKLTLLQRDVVLHAKELAAMPAVSALVDEESVYLRDVIAQCSQKDGEILLNLTVQEKK